MPKKKAAREFPARSQATSKQRGWLSDPQTQKPRRGGQLEEASGLHSVELPSAVPRERTSKKKTIKSAHSHPWTSTTPPRHQCQITTGATKEDLFFPLPPPWGDPKQQRGSGWGPEGEESEKTPTRHRLRPTGF